MKRSKYKQLIQRIREEKVNPCEAKILTIENYEKRTQILQSVVILSRHGDRYPTKPMNKEDLECEMPKLKFASGWKSKCQYGQLTEKGYEQMIKLGQKAAEIYTKELGYVHEEEEVFYRSTDSQRAKDSATGFMEGFSKRTSLKINVVESNKEVLRKTTKNNDLTLIQEFKNEFDKVSKKVKALTNTNDEKILPKATGNLWFQKCHNLKLPDGIKDNEMEELRVMKSFDKYLKHDSTFVKALLTDLFLGKFSFVAAHDSTIAAVLGYLGETILWPGYGSSFVFEKYSDCIRVYFNGIFLKDLKIK